jgi:rubrerythrin
MQQRGVEMSEQDLTLVDAIQIALEAEKRSAAMYKEAAENATDKVIEGLFSSLSAFEQHHYEKVTELAETLAKKGKYIVYEGYSLPIPAQAEIPISDEASATLKAGKPSMMSVLTLAQEVEAQAVKRYNSLSERALDSDGKNTFDKLAQEEQKHLKLMTEVYWNVNDRGIWAWSGF